MHHKTSLNLMNIKHLNYMKREAWPFTWAPEGERHRVDILTHSAALMTSQHQSVWESSEAFIDWFVWAARHPMRWVWGGTICLTAQWETGLICFWYVLRTASLYVAIVTVAFFWIVSSYLTFLTLLLRIVTFYFAIVTFSPNCEFISILRKKSELWFNI